MKPKDAQREKGTFCCVMAKGGEKCYPGLWGNLATILIQLRSRFGGVSHHCKDGEGQKAGKSS